MTENTEIVSRELNKKFRHHSWFREGNKTRAEALDYFAETNDFYLAKRPSRGQSDYLMDDINYDDILVYSGKEGGTYRLSKEEKEYFIVRQNFWRAKKEKIK